MASRAEIEALLGDIPANRDHLPLLEAQFATRAGIVPFVGAGLSAPFGFPQWGAFLLRLANEAGLTSETQTLLDAARYEEAAALVLQGLGFRRFQDLLAAAFGNHVLDGRRLDGAVAVLRRFPAGPIITTNFDRVIETAFDQGGQRLVPYWQAYASKGTEALQQDKPFLLKLHGDWDHPTTRVLTLDEYVAAYGDADGEQLAFTLPVPTLLYKLLTSRCCLFLGCSLKQDRTIQLLRGIARGIPDLVHYAVVERPADDREFRARAAELSAQSIRPVWYPPGRHDLIEPLLHYCAEQAAAGLRRLAVAAARPVAAGVPNNIPSLGNATIGRESEVVELQDMLRVARLVSITGVGGCGKSRLAIEAAASLRDRYHSGVWLVPLASLSKKADREGVLATRIAKVVGATEQASRPPHESLAEHLAAGPCLLVLDNCEHLVASTGKLIDYLLGRCPDLTILVTTRRPLELPLERLYPLAPLATPRESDVTLEAITANESVRLFVARARERSPAWTLRPQEASGIATLCRALEGIPLAIEVAAARLGVLSIDGMAAHRNDLLEALGSKPSGDLRTWTLTAALRWSYGLLAPTQQRLMRALTVFDGGWTEASARAVFAEPRAGSLLDLLQTLHDPSLIVTTATDAGTRYRYLEPVRQMVQLELSDAECASYEARHAAFFLALAEEAAPHLLSAGLARWLETLQSEVDNLRGAIRWTVEQADAEKGLRLIAALWRFTEIRGYLTEGRERARQVMEIPGVEMHPALLSRVLSGAGMLAYRQADLRDAEAKFTRSLALERGLGNDAGIANALNDLGNVATIQGDFIRGRRLYAESLEIERRQGNARGLAVAHFNLGWVSLDVGDYADAERLFTDSLDGFRAGGNERESAFPLNGLARLHALTGRPTVAREFALEGLEIRQRLKDAKGVAESSRTLAAAAIQLGDAADAAARLAESLRLARGVGDRRGVADTFELYAEQYIRAGQFERGVELFAAAREIQRGFNYALPPARAAQHEHWLDEARQALGADAYDAAWRRGTSPKFAATFDAAVASQPPATPRDR